MAKTLPFASSPSLKLLVLTAALSCATIYVHSLTLEADVFGLRSIKRSVDPNSIPPFSYLDSWDFTFDPCEASGTQFQGILCDTPSGNSSSRVTVIELDANGYDGFISHTVGNLTELTILNLSKNRFRGPIPTSISKLRRLTRLSLAENFLTGSIPAVLGELKNLQYLDLSKNNLSGSIPLGVGGLRSLTYLSLSNNGLSSRIPDLSGIWQLRSVDLSSNKLVGNLPNLPVTLRTLTMNHNSISGHLSPLEKLRNLRSIDVSSNRLSGLIGQEIFSLPKLVSINVSTNFLTTLEMTPFFQTASPLGMLDASRNYLAGHLPVNLVSFQNLTVIHLERNQFHGPIPRQYGTKLEKSWRIVYFDHNFLTGNIPPEFITYAGRFTGNLAFNCLQCTANMTMCGVGQKTSFTMRWTEQWQWVRSLVVSLSNNSIS